MNFLKTLKGMPLSKKVLILIMLVFAGIFYATVIGNHYYFRTYAFDYATYNFAFWDYSHFHVSIDPIYHVHDETRMTFLQDHFSLTMFYFIPIYWLFNWLTGSYTLLLLQVTLVLWSGWALYRLIKLKTGDNWLAVLSVLYYFLLQGRDSSFSSDCNILTMICCFIPIFLLSFESKKYTTSFIVFILLLFSREDMPLWFIFIFIVIAIWHWKERRIVKYCIAGIVTSIIYFIFLFKVFIPMIETPGTLYRLFQYSSLGRTPWDALVHILKHPIDTFKLLYENQTSNHDFDGEKKEFYLIYLISGAFLLILRPQYFIWFIPLIAQKMFNDDPVRWGMAGYYCIPVITILPISVFMIISKFKVKWLRYPLAIAVCGLAFYVTHEKMDISKRIPPWGTTVKENVFDSRFFHADFDAAKIHSALKMIPSDAKVCASSSILPHLAQRQFVYEYPDIQDADYLALFTFKDYYITSDSVYTRILGEHFFSPSWDVIANVPPFVLLKKMDGRMKNGVILDSLVCSAENKTADSVNFIASDGTLFGNGDAQDSSKAHTGKYAIRLNRADKTFGFTYQGNKFKKGDCLKITVWKYPASKDIGRLVVSCGKDFYKNIAAGKVEDNSGWVQLEMYITVPEDNSNFKIYTLNSSPTDVWFDDLTIVKCTLK